MGDELRSTAEDLRDRITELERALTPFANYGAVVDHLAKNGLWVGKNWAADPEHVIARCGGAVLAVGQLQRAVEVLKERP